MPSEAELRRLGEETGLARAANGMEKKSNANRISTHLALHPGAAPGQSYRTPAFPVHLITHLLCFTLRRRHWGHQWRFFDSTSRACILEAELNPDLSLTRCVTFNNLLKFISVSSVYNENNGHPGEFLYD